MILVYHKLVFLFPPCFTWWICSLCLHSCYLWTLRRFGSLFCSLLLCWWFTSILSPFWILTPTKNPLLLPSSTFLGGKGSLPPLNLSLLLISTTRYIMFHLHLVLLYFSLIIYISTNTCHVCHHPPQLHLIYLCTSIDKVIYTSIDKL